MSTQLTLEQILKIENFDEKIIKLTELKNLIYNQLLANVDEITECKTLEGITKNSEKYRELKDEYDLINVKLIYLYLDDIKEKLDKTPNKK